MFFGYFSTVGTVGSYVRCVWLFCCLRFDNSRDYGKTEESERTIERGRVETLINSHD